MTRQSNTYVKGLSDMDVVKFRRFSGGPHHDSPCNILTKIDYNRVSMKGLIYKEITKDSKKEVIYNSAIRPRPRSRQDTMTHAKILDKPE